MNCVNCLRVDRGQSFLTLRRGWIGNFNLHATASYVACIVQTRCHLHSATDERMFVLYKLQQKTEEGAFTDLTFEPNPLSLCRRHLVKIVLVHFNILYIKAWRTWIQLKFGLKTFNPIWSLIESKRDVLGLEPLAHSPCSILLYCDTLREYLMNFWPSCPIPYHRIHSAT